MDKDHEEDSLIETPEFKSWRRLHICQSKLTVVGELASLMAFFSVMAAVELQIKEGDASPELIFAFVSTTSLLVATTVIVKVVATSILPHINAVSAASNVEEACRSPHDQIINMIDIICILGNTICPFLFCTDIILLAWIKFKHYAIEAPMAVTAIIVPVQITILIFGIVLYRQTKEYKDKECLLPTRRYSEIAETWDESESGSSSRRSSFSEGSGLLSNSFYSSSYGATFENESTLFYYKSQKMYSNIFR